MSEDARDVTELLAAYREGQQEAFDRLVERLYDEMRELARVQLRQRHPEETLDTTGLVNEAYCKLAGHGMSGWKDRDHFYAACATTMRHLLVDKARRRLRKKRGDGRRALTLEDNEVAAEGDPVWLVELDQLIARLATHDPRLVSVFECRYFAGFSNAETARILSVSERTVERDWARARGWLRHALADSFGPRSG